MKTTLRIGLVAGASLLVGLALVVLFLVFGQTPSDARPDRGGEPVPSRQYKILHIMSYNTPWTWVDRQYEGFKQELEDLTVEYRVFEMDAFRNSSPEWLERKGREARERVNTWKPDLVYTTDDYAPDLVTRHFVGSDIPFVFSGVNKDPEVYGIDKARNVTGVLEREHYVETIKLMQSIFPEMKKIAVILDSNISYEGIVTRMKKQNEQMPELQFDHWLTLDTFEQFKNTVRGLHGKVDAICILGISQFRGAGGVNVAYQEVLQWLSENSKVPDFSFWEDRSYYGILGTVSVSPLEQGRVAGGMARKILVDGVVPGDIPIRASTKGQAIISLRRARDLGIVPRIPAGVLLASRIMENYKWEEQ